MAPLAGGARRRICWRARRIASWLRLTSLLQLDRAGELLGELLAGAAVELGAGRLDQRGVAEASPGVRCWWKTMNQPALFSAGNDPRAALRDAEQGDQRRRHLLALAG